MKIDIDYIKSTLDSRGMPSDDETAKKAFNHWLQIINSYEDDYFTQAMNDIGIEEQVS